MHPDGLPAMRVCCWPEDASGGLQTWLEGVTGLVSGSGCQSGGGRLRSPRGHQGARSGGSGGWGRRCVTQLRGSGVRAATAVLSVRASLSSWRRAGEWRARWGTIGTQPAPTVECRSAKLRSLAMGPTAEPSAARASEALWGLVGLHATRAGCGRRSSGTSRRSCIAHTAARGGASGR